MWGKLLVWLPGCLALLFWGVQTSSAHQYEETLEKAFAFKPGGKLILINTNGKISVGVWDKEKILLRAELKIEAQTPEEAKRIAEKAIEIDLTDTEIEIKTKREKATSLWKLLFGKEEKPKVRRMNYELTLPRKIDLDMRTVNGGIGIADIQGRIEVRTTNGGIDVSGVSGFINARSTNGGIRAELRKADPQGSISLTTTNGGIRLSLPQSIKAEILAKTANGRIHTDLPLEVQGSFSGGRIKGKINGGGTLIELHTANGGIDILSQ